MARTKQPNSQPNSRSKSDYDTFHESLATPADRPSRVNNPGEADYSPASGAISLIAGILDLLLIIRFVTHLVTSDNTLAIVAVIEGLTNWLVAPFNGLFGLGTPTIGSGFVDWGAVIALIVVSLIAGLISRLTRTTRM